MPVPQPPPGVDPLTFGAQALGRQTQVNRDPYVMQRMMEQQAQEQSPEEQQKALVAEMEAQLKEVSAGNKLKEIALKLKDELAKSAELEARIAESPEAAALLEELLKEQAQ